MRHARHSACPRGGQSERPTTSLRRPRGECAGRSPHLLPWSACSGASRGCWAPKGCAPQRPRLGARLHWLRRVAQTLSVALTLWTLVALLAGPDSAATRCPTSSTCGSGSASLSRRCCSGRSVSHQPGAAPAHGTVAARSGLPRRRGLPLSRGVVAGRAGARRLHLGRAVATENTSLPFLRLLILGYLLVSILGAGLFGRAWFDRADPFEGLVQPARRPRAAQATGRRPVGAPHPAPRINELRGERGLVATVAVMLGSAAYDGFSANLSWATFVQTSAVPASVLKTATMLRFFAAVAVTLWLASAASIALSNGDFRSSTPSRFAPLTHPHRRWPCRALLVAVRLPGTGGAGAAQ